MLEVFADALKRQKDDGKLIGRDNEVDLIQGIFHESLETKSTKAIFVHGYSGSGKSCLVDRALHRLPRQSSTITTARYNDSISKVIFVSGKYDQLSSTRPYSALIDACRELCVFLGKQNEEYDENGSDKWRTEKQKVVEFLEKGLENDASLLASLIPELADVLDKVDTETTVSVKGNFQFDRLKKALLTLFTGVTTHFPLVLFIDDLQWSDAASINIFESLLTAGPMLQQFVFVGAYRDNELTGSHPLVAPIQALEQQACSSKIHVGDLLLESLNLLVADLLKFEDNVSLTQPLSACVHRMTNGNIFFALQFLEHLVASQILYYSYIDVKWKWDQDGILAKTHSTDNVVDLVIQKMRRLPPESAMAMLIASQLGSRFDSAIACSMVEQFRPTDKEDEAKEEPMYALHAIFGVPISEGFILPVTCKNDRWYRFSHDKIQEAAAGISGKKSELETLRFRMGGLLNEISKREKQSWAILKAADLLNLATDMITGDEDILDLIKVNLEAAKVSSTQSAFAAAAEYLSKCRQLQGTDKWDSPHYDLTLEIYTLAAEMEFCRGNSADCRRLVNEVRENTNSMRDKLYATYILVKSLGSEARYDESIDLAYEAMNQANFPMPTGGATEKDVGVLFSRCLETLDEKTNDDIWNMAEDSLDDNREICLKLLMSLILFAWHSGRMLDHAVISCNLLLNTLEHGLSEYSGLGFAIFGGFVGHQKLIDVGRRMSTLTLHSSILARCEGKEPEAAMICVVYASSAHISLPFATVAEEFMNGYRKGMKAGIVEWGVANSGLYLVVYYQTGLPLSIFETDSWNFISQMVEYENHVHRPICQLYLQCALNLMGKGNADPMVLDGEALKQYDISRIMDGTLPHFPVQMAWFVQLMLAYYFGNYGLAEKMATMHDEDPHSDEFPMVWSYPHPFFKGLAYLAMARQLKSTKRGNMFSGFSKRGRVKEMMTRAKKQVDLVKTYAEHEMINSLHMLKILEAETLSLDARATQEDIRRAYIEAIKVSTRSGFRQDSALAAERYAMYVCEIDGEEAGYYFGKALECYGEWGASGKVDQIHRDQQRYLDCYTASQEPQDVRSSFLKAKSQHLYLPASIQLEEE